MVIQRQRIEIHHGLDGELFFDAVQSIGEVVIVGKSYGFEWTTAGLHDRNRHCRAPCRSGTLRRPAHDQGPGEQERRRDLVRPRHRSRQVQRPKPWLYTLIPHDEVKEATDMAGYTSEFTAQSEPIKS